MPNRYLVRVAKEQLTFCSGHFISFEGNCCERLHGHNYRVAVEVCAPLDVNHYVFDFIALKRLTKQICDELDHRMLLPTKSPLIHVQALASQVEVQFENRRWSFPLDDCKLLPIENTTAELLARYISSCLKERLQQECGFQPVTMTVEVEESPGQSALYSES